MRLAGPGGLFVLTMMVVAALSLFTLYRLTRRAPVAGSELEDFVPVPLTTSAAYAMHPSAGAGDVTTGTYATGDSGANTPPLPETGKNG